MRTHATSWHAWVAVTVVATANTGSSLLAQSRGQAPDERDSSQRCGPTHILVDSSNANTESLLVLCEKSGEIVRLDRDTGQVLNRQEIGEEPFSMTIGPDAGRIYASCRRGQEVVELDATSLDVLRRFPLVGDPVGVAVSADGSRLYVALHSLDLVAVVDLESGQVTKRLVAGNGPTMITVLPERRLVYVSNLLTPPETAGRPPYLELTVIDDETARILDRINLPNANIGRWMAHTPDEAFLVVAISRPKNLIPMAQVARGWVVTNGFALVSPDGRHPPVQLLVDQPNLGVADPYAVAMTPDGRKFYLTGAGVDQVIAVDAEKARQVMKEALAGEIPRYADHLGLSRRYVVARIPVGACPQSLAIGSKGNRLFVGNRLDDTITVIDVATDQVVQTLTIREPTADDRLARGEKLFHNAKRAFQHQFSCVSCHPEGGVDGLQYDLEPDGIGLNIADNRNMRAVRGTGPFKWNGKNPDIATQCGTRTAKWIVRTGWLSSTQVVELVEYIRSIPAAFNPYRRPDGRLTRAQRRGKKVFERTTLNNGTPLPDRDRCDYCHSGPYHTNGRKFDVGTRGPRDTDGEFDSAHLINLFDAPPYLHDGRAPTLEEIWTVYNREDKHGVSSDWTKQQLNDLMEYLKSL